MIAPDAALAVLAAEPIASASRAIVVARDAADRDLLRRINRELPASVDTVVIGSGDHIFPVGRELKAAGYAVEVLARFGHLSRDLYVASPRYHMIGVG